MPFAHELGAIVSLCRILIEWKLYFLFSVSRDDSLRWWTRGYLPLIHSIETRYDCSFVYAQLVAAEHTRTHTHTASELGAQHTALGFVADNKNKYNYLRAKVANAETQTDKIHHKNSHRVRILMINLPFLSRSLHTRRSRLCQERIQ